MYRDNAQPSMTTAASPRMTDGANGSGAFKGISPFKPEYDQYIAGYPGRGLLKVQISAANEAFPIQGVEVSVSVDYGGVRYLLYDDMTNSSGIVDNMVLPTRPVDTVLAPERSDADEAHYLVTLSHPSFRSIVDKIVTVYDRIETILPITMAPDAQKCQAMGTEGM